MSAPQPAVEPQGGLPADPPGEPRVAAGMAPHAGPRVGSARIAEALRTALEPQALEVLDDSHLHAGHAGAREGGHYTVRITSARFAGLGRVARHRLVYSALASLIPLGIHALAIEARAPGDGVAAA